jgi:hypothetical protein
VLAILGACLLAWSLRDLLRRGSMATFSRRPTCLPVVASVLSDRDDH